MCAIFGSFDKSVLMDLYNRNKYRGKFSFSITSINDKYESVTNKHFGEMTEQHLDDYFVDGNYHICHTQAPTGSQIRDIERIHPVTIKNTKLFHNGIIVKTQVDEIRERYNIKSTFDTLSLATMIVNNDLSILDDIQGSFACVLIEDGVSMKVFRNANSIIHMNDDFDISSTKLKNYVAFKPNVVYNMDIHKKVIKESCLFDNKHNNFYVR